MAQSTTEANSSPSTSHSAPPHKFNPRLLIPVVLVIAGAGAATWYFLSRPKAGELQVSGRLEGYETDIGAKVAGRVNTITVREGDEVTKGKLIVQIDDAEIQAQLRGATAQVENAKQREVQAELQISVAEAQVAEAELNLQQSAGDTQGRVDQATSSVAAAEAQYNQALAQLNQSRSELKLAQINRDRYVQLTQAGAATQQQLDQAQTALDTAIATVQSRQAAVESFLKQVQASQGGLVQAKSNLFNPDIRFARLAAVRKQLNVAKAQLAAAQAEVRNAQAVEQQIKAQIDYLRVVSPIDGVVTARNVEPGAVVTIGKTLLTVINPQTVYLRGYIPEGEIGKVRVGQAAKVYLDSAPNKPLDGRVTAIDTQASFTPENIYFKEDRVKQVFGVKIGIDKPGGYAKPGMPAEATILVDESSQPAKP